MVDTLINLSGGVDSAYALWKFLKTGQVPLVFHCKLGNEFGPQAVRRRREYEWESVQNIISWCKSQGLPEFEFVFNEFDYGSVGWCVNDIEIIGFMNGILLRQTAAYNLRDKDYSNISKIIVSSNVGDVGSIGYEHRSKLRKDITQLVAMRPIEFVSPMKDMQKLDILLECPQELIDLCYWCRVPWGDNKVCGVCDPCKQIVKLKMVKAQYVPKEVAEKWS